MLSLLVPGVGMGGGLAVTVSPIQSYEKEVFTHKVTCELGRTMGLKKAFSEFKNDLEAFIFFMGGR